MHVPAAPLPPPTGTMTTSSPGLASSASRAYVPTPAIRSGSSPEWTYLWPCRRASSSQWARASSKSAPCATTSAPSSSIAATFTRLAPRGTHTIACTPNSRAAYAIDWPWLPVEAAMTPRRRSSSPSWDTRLMPPRTLNAPVGWKFSCLTQTSAPTSADSPGYRRSGVGSRWGRRRRRASSTSANRGASSAVGAGTVTPL